MRVLVVDDDLVSMAIASATVESLGHECREAGDGVAALREMRAGNIDVVVSDWQMPVLDGLELCRQIRQEPAFPYPYFLLLSASGSAADVVQAMEAGVDDYLVKPIDRDQLQARLIAGERVSSLHRRLRERVRRKVST